MTVFFKSPEVGFESVMIRKGHKFILVFAFFEIRVYWKKVSEFLVFGLNLSLLFEMESLKKLATLVFKSGVEFYVKSTM